MLFIYLYLRSLAGRHAEAAENKGIVNYFIFPRFGLREWEGQIWLWKYKYKYEYKYDYKLKYKYNYKYRYKYKNNTDTNYLMFPRFGLREWEGSRESRFCRIALPLISGRQAGLPISNLSIFTNFKSLNFLKAFAIAVHIWGKMPSY